MRCCGSPTTSTAAEPAAPRPAALAEALLFRAVLAPLVRALGPVGDVALGDALERLFCEPLPSRVEGR